MNRKVFVYIVIVLIVLILAINLISSTYNVFDFFTSLPSKIKDVTEKIKDLDSFGANSILAPKGDQGPLSL